MQSIVVTQLLFLKSHGNEEGDEEYLIVDQSPFRVGRRPENDAQISRPDVSGVHAEFRFENDAWWLHDNKSTNGTFLNGKRMTDPICLKIGDIVHFATQGYQVVPSVENAEDLVSTTVLADSADIQGMVELLKIINEQRTYPYFQPLVDLKTNQTIGWESLGRASSATGPLSPGALFRLASQSKVESKLSMRFRDSARHCAECRHCWTSEPTAYLFINIHPAEIHDEGFLESLTEFSKSALKGLYRLVLEMPESWVCNTQEMQVLVKQIRQLGMLVAYDDFGAGQSRLSDLITVPPDFLKLDRQLIASLGSHRVKHGIVKAFVDACRELNVTTLGEGIETEEELAACIEMDIELGQGFLLGRPAPAYGLFNAETTTLPEPCPFVSLKLLDL